MKCKNQGKIYKTNPNLNYMDHTLRTFFLLNHFGVKCSEEEWLEFNLLMDYMMRIIKNIISHIIKTKHLKHHYLISFTKVLTQNMNMKDEKRNESC